MYLYNVLYGSIEFCIQSLNRCLYIDHPKFGKNVSNMATRNYLFIIYFIYEINDIFKTRLQKMIEKEIKAHRTKARTNKSLQK